MKRPLFPLPFLLLITALTVSTQAADRPNILWIFSEDLSPYFGCYGDPINKGHTEAIDQLAAEGVLFTRAYVPAPVCSSCRSAMITGLYQTTTGTHQHRSSRYTDGKIVPEDLRIHLPDGVKPIPQLLKEAGYFTFNNGKDDYNFHYDRRELYSTGTMENYQVGMNGWQGNRAIDHKNIAAHSWDARPDKDQPWFGQITIWG
ncbi:MAG: sulfatase-like hydrolase/transferase, partial [Verrucomicrobiota bacterium]